MRVFLTGVSCVGKTTVGAKLAVLLRCPFFDLDKEVEAFFGTSIERLQNRFLSMDSFRAEAAKALQALLKRRESQSCVIALPPSGLMDNYWRMVKKAGGVIITLTDRPSNILRRITFYDISSRPIEKQLTEREKKQCLAQIRDDINYFRPFYKRAHAAVDVAGLNADQAAARVQAHLEKVGPTA